MSRLNLFRTELVSLDDSGPIQLARATGYAGEELDGMLRVAQHGFASSAPIGSHGLGLALRSERTLGAILGLEHQDHRPINMPAGAAVLYDTSGNVIRAYTTNGIQISAEKGDITVAPKESGKKVYLGGNGMDGSYAKVMTESGPSLNVYAKV